MQRVRAIQAITARLAARVASKPFVSVLVALVCLCVHAGLLSSLFPKMSRAEHIPARELFSGEWRRLCLYHFYHASLAHLAAAMFVFYASASFLESRRGHAAFALLLAALMAACAVALLGVQMLVSSLLEDDDVLYAPTTGISGTAFALAVLVIDEAPPGRFALLGVVPLPSRHVLWAVLLAAHLAVPGAALMAHVAGVACGLSFCTLRSAARYVWMRIRIRRAGGAGLSSYSASQTSSTTSTQGKESKEHKEKSGIFHKKK
eukprot:m51a1_g14338 putative rhomboid domain-containing protein 1 (262) ;mRNA; f:158104-158944